MLKISIVVSLCGQNPFNGASIEEILQRNKACEIEFQEPGWSQISAEAKDLAMRMTLRDQFMRISAKQCIEHPWINNNNTNANGLAPIILVTQEKSKEVPQNTSSTAYRRQKTLTSNFSPKLSSRNATEKIPDASPLILSRARNINKGEVVFSLFV